MSSLLLAYLVVSVVLTMVLMSSFFMVLTGIVVLCRV